MKKKKIFMPLILSIIIVGLTFYITYPALNPQTLSFISILIFMIVIIAAIFFIFNSLSKIQYHQTHELKIAKLPMRYLGPLAIIIIVAIVGNLFYSPMISSNLYATRIDVVDSDFTTDIKQVDLENLPLLDKASTQKVGDRVMGQLPELISQFEVSDQYTQINYNGRLVRVTPLEYNGIFKWFNNRNEGVPGYIIVDSTTGVAELVKLDKGMKYMSSAYFNEKLERHIRFQYPTKILGTPKFEIDDEGQPYYITPVYKVKWIEMLPDIAGAIITNPCDGSSQYYAMEDVPTWVDHVVPSSLVLEQINSWGLYQDGWLNSFIGQKNVRQSTEGYTYLANNDDIYVYTGITSAAADQSNIGFVLINLRTKDTKYYAAPGAEEFSAMASAEGAVQEKRYSSTFPLLINLDNRPTYLSSLKDSAGLVKAYAFIDVTDYQKVKVTDSSEGLQAAANAYLEIIGSKNTIDNTVEIKGEIIDLQSVVVDGFTTYYLKLNTSNTIYKVKITLNDNLPFIAIGQKVTLHLADDEIKQIEIAE